MGLREIGNTFNFKILFSNRYCKAVYPSKDVRNVVEANNCVLVDNSRVTPYRCLGELIVYRQIVQPNLQGAWPFT